MGGVTMFFGSCDVCGEGYAVEVHVVVGLRSMPGPEFVVVCQKHHPVGQAVLVNEKAMGEDQARKWRYWTREAATYEASRTGADRG